MPQQACRYSPAKAAAALAAREPELVLKLWALASDPVYFQRVKGGLNSGIEGPLWELELAHEFARRGFRYENHACLNRGYDFLVNGLKVQARSLMFRGGRADIRPRAPRTQDIESGRRSCPDCWDILAIKDHKAGHRHFVRSQELVEPNGLFPPSFNSASHTGSLENWSVFVANRSVRATGAMS